MFPRLYTAAGLALLASRLAVAQTFSDCNPYKGDKCDPNPAFGSNVVNIDFTKGASDVFKLADATSLEYDDALGAVFTINSGSDAPTIISNKYLFFGRVDVVVQAAPGAGIVTSFTLQSDDLDEIDWEWIGSDANQCQSNYFGKGDTTTYDRGAYHAIGSTTSSFHTYSIEWTSASIQWIIDGNVVRTLNYADAQGGARYPQTPMQVRLGTWVGGLAGNSQGTIDWAGGLANFDNAPFKAYYKSITIRDYSNGVANAKEYVYGDASGSFGSIKVITGDGSSSGTTTATSSKPTTETTMSTVTTKTGAGATTTTGPSTTTGSSGTSVADSETTPTGTDTNVSGNGATSLPVSHAVLSVCALILGAILL